MAYKGDTLHVNCGQGALTGAENIDSIPNYMMVDPTSNIIFEKNGRRKRGGTAHLYATAYPGTVGSPLVPPTVIGIDGVKFTGGSQVVLCTTSEGDIYDSETNLINAALKATGIITSTGTNVSDGDTVVIDTKTYTFKTNLTPTEGEVLIGASAAASLDNLKAAINHTGTPDTDYKCAAVHPTVSATTNSDTAQHLEAKTAGAAGNTIVLLEVAAQLGVSGAGTLTNGADKVSFGTTKPISIVMGENKAFMADGARTPLVWSGSGQPTQIIEPAADFAANPVIQLLLHKKGLSSRMCALNSNTLFFSKSYVAADDMEYFATGAESLYLDSGDSVGLVGMTEVGDEIMLFSRDNAYRVDDSDTDASNWSISKCQWNGGVANWRLLIKTPNDLIAMAMDGEIYSVMSVNAYGDYKLASLTAPSWMHDWIKNNVDISKIDQFHGVYDPTLRVVKIFVVKDGASTCNMALLYYPDREPTEAWMIHDNSVNPSGYNAASACVIQQSDGNFTVYTGGYNGLTWKLNQAARNDNSLGYYGGFKTPPDVFGDARSKKHYNGGNISMEAKGTFFLKVRIWIDDSILSTLKLLSMGGAGEPLDTLVLDTGYLAGSNYLDVPFKIGRTGKRLQYEFFTDGINEDFFINSYFTDCKPLGKTEAKAS